MEDYFRFVNEVVQVLENCQTRYVIGGSMASSYYGEIRATYDVDLTIQLSFPLVQTFTQRFLDKGWYIVPESVLKAVQTGGDFQIIDGMSGLKADCYMTTPIPTPRQERTFSRAKRMVYAGGQYEANFMSPEDVILYKMDWYLLGNSQKHIRDICAMLWQMTLDHAYIQQWSAEINAQILWSKLESELCKRNGE